MDTTERPGQLTRRDLLRIGGPTLLAATTLTGCQLLSTKPANGRSTGQGGPIAHGVEQKEAPALANLVAAGKLPPLAERLPDHPLVVKPTRTAGRYGGTWHSAMVGPDDLWMNRTVGYEYLMRWNPEWTKAIPNVAESVDISADGRTFTFTLRSGMKWSDGAPFTASDVEFAYRDVLLDKNLTPVTPEFLTSRGQPAKLDRIDDYMFRFVFAHPNGVLLERLAGPDGSSLTGLPQHYLKEFHAKHNPDVVKAAKQQGHASWAELFLSKSDAKAVWASAELPRLHAWRVKTPLGSGGRMELERNPYYFKTDPDGRQLPYLDRVRFNVVSNEQVILLMASNGELDFHTRHINTLPNKPVLARNREKGKFHFTRLVSRSENEMVIALNLNHQDAGLRALFQDRNFRIGLSHAIDRQDLIKAVWQRQGMAWQAAPRKESAFFDEEFATQYTSFDVDLANSFLDRAGCTDRDSDGFRLMQDGRRVAFVVEIASPTLVPFWVDAMQLVRDYWKRVGIDAQVKSEDRGLFYERKEANKHDATVWIGAGSELFDPRWYFPFSVESNFATRWAEWFTSRGSLGQEPPAATRQQMELYRQAIETPDQSRRTTMLKEVLRVAKEQFYVIGTVIALEGYGIVKDNLHNVPDSIPDSWVYLTPGPTNPEQYFLADS